MDTERERERERERVSSGEWIEESGWKRRLTETVKERERERERVEKIYRELLRK